MAEFIFELLGQVIGELVLHVLGTIVDLVFGRRDRGG
jgi:hypothetical protein